MKTLISTLVLSFGAAFPTWAKPHTAAQPWKITHARIFLPTPGAKATAGYFELENQKTTSINVSVLEIKPFARVETHETVKENDHAKMIQVDQFQIEAQGKLELLPGGKHIMLFEPQKTLKKGEVLQAQLKIDGTTVTVPFTVMARDEQGSAEHHHH